MKIRNFCAQIVTIGPLGSMPASGTWGSLVGLLIAWLYAESSWYIPFVFLIGIASWIIIECALPAFSQKDPSVIILDEVMGMLIVFCAVPFSLPVAIIGFLLFRFFDISKCCGVKWFEKLPKAAGVLLDDCFAAVLSISVLCIFLYCNVL